MKQNKGKKPLRRGSVYIFYKMSVAGIPERNKNFFLCSLLFALSKIKFDLNSANTCIIYQFLWLKVWHLLVTFGAPLLIHPTAPQALGSALRLSTDFLWRKPRYGSGIRVFKSMQKNIQGFILVVN